MEDYPIKVGSALFTLVEPRRGHEVAYNRWYERDHFYAGCMIGPGNFAGRRWVSTQRHKALRVAPPGNPVTGDVADAGSYLALYWVLAGMHDEWNRWGVDQVNHLHATGRMFAERDHIHTLLYRRAWDAGAGVPAELALDHSFGGLTATLVELADGVTPTQLGDWVGTAYPPELEIGFTPIPLAADAPVTQRGLDHLDRRVLNLSFTRESPATWWDEQRAAAAKLEDDGIGTMLWTAPFIPTIPGTDTYTDQLW